MENVIVNSDKKSFILTIVKGVLFGIIISLVGILVFAFFIKIVGIETNLIKPVNQVIKIASIFIGVLVSCRKIEKRAYLYGLLIGIVYSLFAFILFSILNGGFVFDRTLLNDLLFSGITEIICAIIVSFFKRK